MMGDSRKMKSSKAYIKEVNKSSRALFKDVRDEITGGRFNAIRATVNSMKAEARQQKQGFYTTALKKAFNDSNLVRLTKDYHKSVSKALKTGKLYTRESDIFDDMMKKQNKFMSSNDDTHDPLDIALGAKQTNATYDAAKAQISSMNTNADAQMRMDRQGIAETKMGFNRMSAALSVGTQQQVQALTRIQSILSDNIAKRLDESINLDKSRNALLTEIRDLNKKMVINNDTYQQMGIEKSKSVMDLLMEGRFKDALGKGTENVIKEFDSKNIVQTMSYMLPTFMQQMISNPFGMVKDMLLDENTKLGRLKGQMDPKRLMTDFMMGAAGSRNNYKSRTAKALMMGDGKSVNTMNIESTAVNRQAVQWSGLERRALVTVIPTYLRKILAALDKEDELIYNYDDGRGGAGFTNAKEMSSRITSFKNRSVSGTTDVSSAINSFYKAEEAKAGRQSNFSHTAIFDMFVKDLTMSAYPTSIRASLKYSFIEYKNMYPNTPLTSEMWFLLSMPAKALLAGTDEESKKFGKYIDALNKNIDKHKEESNTFAALLNRDTDYSGYDSFANGSKTLKQSKRSNNGGGTGGGPTPPGPIDNRTEQEMLDDILKVANEQNQSLTDDSAAELLAVAGANQGELAKLIDRANYTNALDFENSGMKVNALHFRNWLDENYKKLPDDLKERLAEHAKHERYEKIIPHVKDFGLYLDQVRYEHMRDTTKTTEGEKKKIQQLKDMQTRHGQFNSAFDGLERSVNGISEDPGKLDAMQGFVKKMVIAGGVAGLAGAKGLIPFAGHMGLGGITAMALGGVALTALANRKKLAELLTGGMTEEEKANGKKVTSFIWSKAITGLGSAGIAGLGAAVLGAGPVLAPLLAATTGIAVAMNSEKKGFKRFFFGEDHDQDKTFFQLFKTKMLGDKDSNDDGIFGRFLNPVFEKTGSMFDKFNENMEKKVLEPLGKSLKTAIEKIDASAFGEKFKDTMGFTLSEFGGIMKKNVWMPLTKSIFGGIKKLFGWGRKKKDDIQDNQKAEYGVGDTISDMYNASNAPGADGNPTDPGPLPPDPPAGNPPGPDRSADHANGDYGNPLSGSGARRMNLSRVGGSVIKGKGGLGALDLTDIVNAVRVPIGDKKNLIGKGKSEPAKHYYSQLDPLYKDIKMGILGFTKVEDAGCSIMAASMVLSRFGKINNENKGKELTPKFVADVLIPLAKPYTTKNGVDYLYFKALADKFNMEYSVRKNEQQFTLKEIKGIVSGGKGAIVALTKQKTLGNHFIVITGVNGENVYYDDPARKRALMMTYEDFCEGTYVAIGLTKTKGLFGFIGKLFKGLTNFLSGDALKSKRARQWNVRKELIDRMTRKEWQKYRNERKIPGELIDKLKARTPMMNHLDGSAIKDKDGKVIDDKDFAQTMFNNKIKELSGSGARKKKAPEKPKNAVDKIMEKSKYFYNGTGLPPRFITKDLRFGDDDHYKSYMLSATLHQTSTVSTLLAAIYTKISEQEITLYNGTNGVAYNLEFVKRMTAIKAFGSVGEAATVVGPIDETKLANSRFFGRRKGIIGSAIQGLKDMGGYIKSKTVDPVVIQYMMIKSGFEKFGRSLRDGLLDFKDGLVDFAHGLGDTLKELVPAAGKLLAAPFKMLGSVISGGFQGLGSAIGGLWKGLGSALNGFFEGFSTSISSLVGGIVDIVKDIPSIIGGSLNALTGAISNMALGMVSVVSTLGGTAYKAARTVVKDIWGAGGAALKGIGRGITGVKNFFTGKHSDWKEKDITYVKVLGGHIDTVGAVGAVDRDAYVTEVKNQKRTFGRATDARRSLERLGGSTTKGSKVNTEIDKEQDTAAAVQEKQNELLEELVEKPAAAGVVDDGKKKDFDWANMAQNIMAIAPVIAGAVALVLEKYFGSKDKTKDGNDTDPNMFSTDERDRKDYWNNTGLTKDPRKVLALGKTVAWGAKATMTATVRNATDDVMRKKALDALSKNADDVAEVATKSKGLLIKAGSTLATAIKTIVESPKVAYMLESVSKGMAAKVYKNIDTFVEKIAKSPAVVRNAAKIYGEKAVAAFAKALPFVGAGFAIYDFISGWNQADEFFNIPEAQVPTYLKLTSALTKCIKGLITSIPVLVLFAILSDGDVAQYVFDHFIGTPMQKAEVKKLSDAAKERYDTYKKQTEGKGGKATTFDRWVKNGGKGDDAVKKAKATKGNDAVANSLGYNYMTGNSSTFNTGSGYGNYGVPGGAPVVPGINPNKAPVTKPGTGAGAAGMIAKDGDIQNTAGTYAFPLRQHIITSRALQKRWLNGQFKAHKGIDLRAKEGTPVYAIEAGTVVKAGWQDASDIYKGYGRYVAIKHANGTISKYAHLSKVEVVVGQSVQRGNLIGYSGHTGGFKGMADHLHFELRGGLGQDDAVFNPEKFYKGFTYSDPTSMKNQVVYGNRNGVGVKAGTPTNNTGISTNMYSQNYNLNMGVGGDNMSLSQVGCGPVTTNLFLQESGYKEPLEKTAQALRFQRSSNEGFDSKTLSKYISLRNVSNKIMTKINKNALIIAKFGILFAKRSSAINKLEDHHAMFMKNTNQLGATLFDPYLETYKFYTWDAIMSSVFEAIVPGGSGNVKGPGDSEILSDTRSVPDTSTANALNNMNKLIDLANKNRSMEDPPIPKTVAPTVKGPGENSNNINLESKLDTVIALLTQLVVNTAGGNSKDPKKDASVDTAIGNVMKTMMQAASQPRSTEKSNDAWWQSRMRISKGGL